MKKSSVVSYTITAHTATTSYQVSVLPVYKEKNQYKVRAYIDGTPEFSILLNDNAEANAYAFDTMNDLLTGLH